ncbi:hypothetical protein FOXYSP1_17751 [Fusarium oxysporum f. sp. phaseoli]
MYTAPIQEALQMIRARISTAAIVDSLAQHVLCSVRRPFWGLRPPGRKIYIHTYRLAPGADASKFPCIYHIYFRNASTSAERESSEKR